MVMGWSPGDVHPRDRTAWWVDQVAAACQVDSEPRRGAAFFGHATLADVAGGLQIGTGAASAQVISRSQRQIARGDDRLFVTIMTAGQGLVSQDSREAVCGPGDLVLADRR